MGALFIVKTVLGMTAATPLWNVMLENFLTFRLKTEVRGGWRGSKSRALQNNDDGDVNENGKNK